jgi:recombination protein RecT
MKTDGPNKEEKNFEPKPEEEGTLKQQLVKQMKSFEMALPETIKPERMMRIVMTAMQTSKNLANCEPRSFFGAVLTAMQLALEPNTPLGHCYLIPRWDKKKKSHVCTFEMGYQGMLELAYRSRLYKRISAKVVYTGDNFSFSYGKNHHLDHQPKWKSQEPLFVYADYELENGGYDFAVWSWDAILKHAQEFSDSYDSEWSPWKSSQTSAEEMAKKTVLKSLLKYGPRSVEIAAVDMSKALNFDGTAVFANKVQNGTDTTIQYDVQHIIEDKPSDVLRQPPPKQEGNAEKAQVGTTSNAPSSELFDAEEAAHLEEQFNRDKVEPPAFD